MCFSVSCSSGWGGFRRVLSSIFSVHWHQSSRDAFTIHSVCTDRRGISLGFLIGVKVATELLTFRMGILFSMLMARVPLVYAP